MLNSPIIPWYKTRGCSPRSSQESAVWIASSPDLSERTCVCTVQVCMCVCADAEVDHPFREKRERERWTALSRLILAVHNAESSTKIAALFFGSSRNKHLIMSPAVSSRHWQSPAATTSQSRWLMPRNTASGTCPTCMYMCICTYIWIHTHTHTHTDTHTHTQRV